MSILQELLDLVPNKIPKKFAVGDKFLVSNGNSDSIIEIVSMLGPEEIKIKTTYKDTAKKPHEVYTDVLELGSRLKFAKWFKKL